MASVQLHNVAKRFADTEVLRSLDLAIDSGEFVVFVGASGCGKSTLLRLIAGLEQPTGGRILIDGRDVTDLPPAERGVSMVFQSYALYPHMTVRENISFGLKLARTGRAAIQERVERVARMLQLEALLDRRPAQLSGGQRQRVAIARAIVREPRVFLFDEPLSNLDAALRAHTRLEIAQLHRSLGATMVYVTHDQTEAMSLADRMVLLRNGGIEQVGTPDELYHHPATTYVAGFLGTPGMNFLDLASETAADLLAQALHGEAPPPHGAIRTVGVRPEDIQIGAEGAPATVVHVEDLGEARIVHASLGGQAQVAVRTHGAGPRVRNGDTLRLRFAPERLHCFDAGGRRIGT
ncbi:MAG: ABC transporter ATP-binding protein [Pseudomonadota bacterium]|jgi:ABC-type sugar transport system ATPase subunit|nr:MAG: ABC transporter ATP-binding protein [Pseudomonadota bacterium]